MTSTRSDRSALAELARALAGWLAGWWRIVHLSALVLALALSPASYGAANRHSMARHIYVHTAPSLLWFTVLVSLLSLVLIRIVLVTSQSYGLTQYALEMVVRVLVLELIPLTAAVFAAALLYYWFYSRHRIVAGAPEEEFARLAAAEAELSN